jgi:hypothetical protein
MKALRSLSLASSVLGALAAFLPGCGTNPASTSVVCTDFRAGADLSGSTFGVTGDLQRPYGAFAQAAGDLAAVANQMLRDVGASCQGLAVELGADRNDPRTSGKGERDAVRAWCKIAAERFDAVKPQLTRAAFVIRLATPKCTIDTGFQEDCEKKCAAQPTCTEPSIEERCPVDGREGVCPGMCTGTCTGSETAPAACEGSCSGTCFGTCGDANQPDDENGATDCSMGCTCTKVCKGACTAACNLPAAGAHCDALCAGGCSEPMRAFTCNKPLAPPKCAGDVDCQKSCSASSAARAVCPAGSLTVDVAASARNDEKVAQIVGALERHLPAIFLAARGRASVLESGASDLLDSAGRILNRADELGPMGAACGLLIGQTGDEARRNLTAALGGSKDVTHAVAGDDVAPPPPQE